MSHKHQPDDNEQDTCCSHTEKIHAQTKHHHDDDGHDHSHNGDKSTFSMFLPAGCSFVLLLLAIAFDNWIPQGWFNGWIRIVWYIAAYIPVGFPVLKDAVNSIRKGDVFSEFLLMGIATIGAFAIGEYPEGVAVMLFYAVGEVFQTLAVKRASMELMTSRIWCNLAKIHTFRME